MIITDAVIKVSVIILLNLKSTNVGIREKKMFRCMCSLVLTRYKNGAKRKKVFVLKCDFSLLMKRSMKDLCKLSKKGERVKM